MKSFMCLLVGIIFSLLPTESFAQGDKSRSNGSNPYQVLYRCDKGTPIKVILKSGRMIKGKFDGGELSINRERFVKVIQNGSIQTIPLVEIHDVRFNYNLLQRVGHGFKNVGKGILFPFEVTVYFLAYGIDWLTHSGDVKWN